MNRETWTIEIAGDVTETITILGDCDANVMLECEIKTSHGGECIFDVHGQSDMLLCWAYEGYATASDDPFECVIYECDGETYITWADVFEPAHADGVLGRFTMDSTEHNGIS